MKVDDVRRTIDDMRHYAAVDDASAHRLEDVLYQSVLAAIADDDLGDTAFELATAALESMKIQFNRRCGG